MCMSEVTVVRPSICSFCHTHRNCYLLRHESTKEQHFKKGEGKALLESIIIITKMYFLNLKLNYASNVD